MTTHLTDEMRQALHEHPDQPLFLVDAQTQNSYVLLPSSIYQRLKAILFDDSNVNADELLPLAQEAFQEAWDAPGMEAYDDYDSHRPTS